MCRSTSLFVVVVTAAALLSPSFPVLLPSLHYQAFRWACNVVRDSTLLIMSLWRFDLLLKALRVGEDSSARGRQDSGQITLISGCLQSVAGLDVF